MTTKGSTDRPLSGVAEADRTDDQALAMRSQGRAFAAIATALGYEKSLEANQAFNRALRRRPPAEQAAIRRQENRRLDRLAETVRSNGSLSTEQVDKRLHTIDRLRTRLMNG